MRRIGIDVGGTNTDAVILDGAEVVASAKVPTTADTTSGVRHALAGVLRDAGTPAIGAVMIGTTRFINAVAQRRELARVAAIRICLPTCASIEPFHDWPSDLRAVVEARSFLVAGGRELDGRPIAPFDREAVAAAARVIRDEGIESVAVTSVFSPIDPSEEIEAEGILRSICPDVQITLSHRLGRLGLLERENAALLNACLMPLAKRTIAEFEAAVLASGLTADLYLTQNDGTVIRAGAAARSPVFTFASGATNSMRGAAMLSGLGEAIVIDVGGTTSDIGVINNGFPRESNSIAEVGGVRTMFRLPDLVSLPIGGGTLIDLDPLRVGPVSVGYELTRRALVFGGRSLTGTDLGVAAGRISIGDPAAVGTLDRRQVSRAMDWMAERFSEAIERLKTSAADVPVVTVGGGAFLIPETLQGASRLVRVPHGDVANAVGAATAQVAGEVDRVYQSLGRKESLDQASASAREECIAAGGDPATIKVVDVDDIPLAYMPGDALRVRVRVVGDLALTPRSSSSRPVEATP